MGAPSAGVQSPQSSSPAGKGAGRSPSSEPMGKGGASMSAISGQPTIGQPNTNSNSGLDVATPTLVAQNDNQANNDPYANTVGQTNMPTMTTGQPRVNQIPRNIGGGKGKGA
jgi:hypothetical protein